MSKSKGNLVLVSAIRRSGLDPMAIRLALLGQHYREPWDWTDEIMAAAVDRLARWRGALSGVRVGDLAGGADVVIDGGGGSGADRPGTRVVAELRAALADDLNAPAALRSVDEWVRMGAPGERRVVATAVDALLGIRL
jgi:L-cysteine:1D-myo-inositol 2-amino-2-deoxy-alpha-D-glucopyranoside ligase